MGNKEELTQTVLEINQRIDKLQAQVEELKTKLFNLAYQIRCDINDLKRDLRKHGYL